ncbi:leucine-rich repeat protein [Mogibacterium sp. NSJ-24]|uniref:Leucine-rich repeat protein n=1 Tax=Lentihominibacter hominis TaxID=2763645 RepID=A0A926E8B0_9FIRM|nr:Mur ligase family protein [Lentihominibacter hominis]MBC8569053.1 leucine-rich repeat protein [Lentihominibacter hominis]
MLLNKFVTKMTLKEICNFANIEVPPYLVYMQNMELTNMALHRIFMRKGGALFLTAAYKGKELKNILNSARKAGVVAIFVTYQQYRECENKPDLIPCALPGEIARKISNKIRRDLNLKVIGITGSIGKTTTKDFIYTVVKGSFNSSKSIGNENTQYPIFHNMQRMSKNTEVFVQEFGMGSPGTISYALDACNPDIGVITNIKEAHIHDYGTAENILKEKEKMVKKMSVGSIVVLNYDDDTLRNWDWNKYKTIWVSLKNKNSDYYADNIVEKDGHLIFEVFSAKTKFKIDIPILGKHNVSNALMAVAVGDLLGISKEKIEKSFESYQSTGIRQNLVNIGGYKIYLDCYNNTDAEALVGAIEVLEKLEVKKGGKRVAVISDVNIGDADKDKLININKRAGELIANTVSNIDLIFCFGDECAETLYNEIASKRKNVYYSNSREELNNWIKENVTSNDVTLYKGAFRRRLQRTVDQVYGTCFSTAASTNDFFTDNYKYRIIDETIHDNEKLVSLIQYTGNEEEVEIPSEIEGMKVFSVGSKCFANNSKIIRVKIGNGISNIDNIAFMNCTALKEVVLPNSLKLIGQSSFKNCSLLKNIELPMNMIEIGEKAFENCKELEYLTILEKVGRIGKNAFLNCPKLVLSVKNNKYAKLYAKENNIKL